ncbi:unnamed protein product [Knipowitschia caucasica]
MGGGLRRQQHMQKATRAYAVKNSEGFKKDLPKPTESKCQLHRTNNNNPGYHHISIANTDKGLVQMKTL